MGVGAGPAARHRRPLRKVQIGETMSLEKELAIAHETCPCWEPPWGDAKCRNCASQGKHYVDDCEWRGHAAIGRIVELLEGKPDDLADIALDLKGVPEFDRGVYDIARTIPPGATLSSPAYPLICMWLSSLTL